MGTGLTSEFTPVAWWWNQVWGCPRLISARGDRAPTRPAFQTSRRPCCTRQRDEAAPLPTCGPPSCRARCRVGGLSAVPRSWLSQPPVIYREQQVNLPAPKGHQRDVVYLPAHGHQVVLGTAGTGKTVMAIHRAAHLADTRTRTHGSTLGSAARVGDSGSHAA